MKKIVLVFLLVFLLSVPAWSLDVGQEISKIASALQGNYSIGTPINVGQLTIIPVIRINVFSAGSGEKSFAQWAAGGVSLEPVALVVIKGEELTVYPVGKGDAETQEMLRNLPVQTPVKKALPDEKIKELLEKGKESLKNKKFDDARKTFEGIIQTNPDLSDAHALLGQALGELAQTSNDLNQKIRFGMEAFQEFAKALEINPDNPYALVARGYARMVIPPPLGGMDLALEDFSKAVASNPQMVEGYSGLGEAYLKKGDKGKAKESFKKVLELDPKNKRAKEALNKISGGGNK